MWELRLREVCVAESITSLMGLLSVPICKMHEGTTPASWTCYANSGSLFMQRQFMQNGTWYRVVLNK